MTTAYPWAGEHIGYGDIGEGQVRNLPRQRKILLVLIAVAMLAAGAFSSSYGKAGAEAGKLSNLRTVLEVAALVKTQYVEPVSMTELLKSYVAHGTINGMLKILDDPYTRYLEPYAYKQMQLDTTGIYGGIGIVVGIRDEKLTIVAPIEQTPGFHAGLRGGDVIESIDGKPTKHMSQDEAVSYMRGEAGAKVILGIRKKNGEFQEVPIIREIIEVRSVTKQILFDDGVGYVRLSSFSERTSQELEQALASLEEQGMRSLILDLRGNPGGLLTAAIDVANKFIPGGPILHVVGRNGVAQTVEASAQHIGRQYPMVVMVDGYSASASEIVSGALKDTGMATLIGAQTFGKGLVQTVIPLRDGSAVSLTTARYQTAGGHDIHSVGIMPDVIVELPEGEEPPYYTSDVEGGNGVDVSKDIQLQAALELLQERELPKAS
ncbi:MAG: S41 family peptidase [Firmicutes bacterium]|nr:S41 family peptidase [Bacillota bacterium]